MEDMAFWGKFFFAVGDKIHREIGGALKNGTINTHYIRRIFTKHFRYLKWSIYLYKLYVRLMQGKTHTKIGRIRFRKTSMLGT